MKRLWFALVIGAMVMAVIAGTAFAGTTGTIRGTVLDKATNLPIPGSWVKIQNTMLGCRVNHIDGLYEILNVPAGLYTLEAGCIGYAKVTAESVRVQADSTTTVNFILTTSTISCMSVEVTSERKIIDRFETSSVSRISSTEIGNLPVPCLQGRVEFNTEQYDRIYDNEFLSALDNPLSTFSIDVDAASYSNVRRFINSGAMPPEDAVRTEEFINYFAYDYPQPAEGIPFSITAEVAEAPWKPSHKLVHIGIQGKNIQLEDLAPSNLVFLIDVSGSMADEDKLPLLKTAFKLLVGQLREDDKVAIVVYASAEGLVLPSTPGSDKEQIPAALDRLQAGGCTAGGAGMKLAYEIAKQNFVRGANNRIIWATDGDFNVGPSSDAEMVRMVEERREQGIFLTILGFGEGNLKDSRMEKIADKGNGNYYYIDSIQEAKKVFVGQLGGTLYTIAKDVKIQVEFNPARVAAYRLVGYENRLLSKEDFNDDKKDAGEMGAGHSVTALYEITPVGSEVNLPSVDPLKYLKRPSGVSFSDSPELLTVKIRYKKPDGSKSHLIENPVLDCQRRFEMASTDFRFSAAVAEFCMLLRDSKFKANSSFAEAAEIARDAYGKDEQGYRREFVNLVETCDLLSMKALKE